MNRRRRGNREELRDEQAPDSAWVWRMSRLTRDGTAEPVSRDQVLRREQGQGSVQFPCSADHEHDWQSYSVDPYSAISDDHMYNSVYCQQKKTSTERPASAFFVK